MPEDSFTSETPRDWRAETRSSATPRAARSNYTPLPTGFWVACTLLLLFDMGLGGVIWYVESLRAHDSVVIPFAGRNQRNMKKTGGVFATFYHGASFESPFEARFLEGNFTYRSDFEFGADFPDAPVSGKFAARLRVPSPGKYKFYIDADDAAKIWINNVRIFDRNETAAINEFAMELQLPAGEVPLYVEWQNRRFNGWLGIRWEGMGRKRDFLPAELLIPDPGARY